VLLAEGYWENKSKNRKLSLTGLGIEKETSQAEGKRKKNGKRFVGRPTQSERKIEEEDSTSRKSPPISRKEIVMMTRTCGITAGAAAG